MRLIEISVTDHRNIKTLTFAPGEGLNVICGENGQGKTNLLEAVWLLTGGKSFRRAKDAELIRAGQEFSILDGIVETELGEDKIFLTVGSKQSPRPGRTVKLNGVDMGRAAAIAGRFTAVVFDPGNLSLVKGSPDGRRRFLDTALCQLYPGYLAALRRYTRLVAQKNSLLKQWQYTANASIVCDAFDKDLALQGEEVSRRRRRYLQLLGPIASKNYEEISQGREQLRIAYAAAVEEGTLAEAIRHRREQDIRAGFCTLGPHREDFSFLLNDQPAKIFASQGQQRSCVLSLKLAEASVGKEITGQFPVMLLDDVLSELDASRQEYLLTRMQGRQTIVTACDSSLFHKTDGQMFRMQNGTIEPLSL